MASKRSFWRFVWREAVADYLKYLRESRDHVIGFLVVTSIIFALLYWVPQFGDFDEQIGPTAAGVIAVIATAVLRFMVGLVRAVSTVYHRTAQQLADAENFLGEHEDIEAIRAELYNLYWEGRRLYEEEGDYYVWKGPTPQDWLKRTREFALHHYETSVVFMFETGTSEANVDKKVGIYNYPPNTDDLRGIFRSVKQRLYALDMLAYSFRPKAESFRSRRSAVDID